MEKEGFGEEFSICSSFCFGEIWGGRETEKTNSILLCLYHSIAHTKLDKDFPNFSITPTTRALPIIKALFTSGVSFSLDIIFV